MEKNNKICMFYIQCPCPAMWYYQACVRKHLSVASSLARPAHGIIRWRRHASDNLPAFPRCWLWKYTLKNTKLSFEVSEFLITHGIWSCRRHLKRYADRLFLCAREEGMKAWARKDVMRLELIFTCLDRDQFVFVRNLQKRQKIFITCCTPNCSMDSWHRTHAKRFT